jgi:opacity protein-like surface antigen
MRGLAIACGLFCGVILLSVPAPVLAQDQPAADIGGGYSLVRDYRVKENLPLGWFASGAYNITDWLAAVGEIGGSNKSYDFTVDSDTFSTNTRLHTFLGGARHSRRLKGTTPFGQVLVGVARETGGVTIFRPSIATSQTKLALQPGGGIDIPVTDRISARLAADYRRIFARRENTDQKDNNEVRFAVGLVVGFGGR